VRGREQKNWARKMGNLNNKIKKIFRKNNKKYKYEINKIQKIS
jgi:hypothetical protein